jgi:alkane 1-monooxygenase
MAIARRIAAVSATPAAAAPPARRDPKRHLWALALLTPVLPLEAWLLVKATGLGAFWWWGPFFTYALMPVLDAVQGRDTWNPPDAAAPALEAERYYRWCTWLYLPLQYASLVCACAWWASGELSRLDSLGLALTVGVVGGIAINTAHELGHKRARAERRLARVALAQSCYGHFFVEHNRGHHVAVATPEDPSSARLGESFWAFLPRTLLGSVRSAWRIDRRDVLEAWALSAALFAALVAVFGARILPYLLLQAAFAIGLLEVVNYIQHYGLQRRKLADGRYERLRAGHSWNAATVASNIALFNLQRHSDHHANALRRYPALRHLEDAPQLPGGYPAMILLAYVPPLWRRVMDRRVRSLTPS